MGNVIRLSSARTHPVTRQDAIEPGAAPVATFRGGEDYSSERTSERWFEGNEVNEDVMLDQLDRRDRLRLVEFVCSFAWADLEIQPEERVFISKLIRRLGLDEDEDLQVQQWLDRPPMLDHLDPTSIPAAHRRFFVDAIEGLISADGEIAQEESDSFEIFKQLLTD